MVFVDCKRSGPLRNPTFPCLLLIADDTELLQMLFSFLRFFLVLHVVRLILVVVDVVIPIKVMFFLARVSDSQNSDYYLLTSK